jgi:hypothetical protein
MAYIINLKELLHNAVKQMFKCEHFTILLIKQIQVSILNLYAALLQFLIITCFKY